MKQIFLLGLMVLASKIYGQTVSDTSIKVTFEKKATPVHQPPTYFLNEKLMGKSFGQTVTDYRIKVTYEKKATPANHPTAIFLNGKFLGNFKTLDPKMIDSMYIVGGMVKIDGTQYNGQIFIRTKKDYHPNLITLAALKDKYTNLRHKSVLFMIDGNIVDVDYDKYFIDENHVLQIVVGDLKNTKENIDLTLVKLLTKSEENIKKSNEIRIRGGELAMNK